MNLRVLTWTDVLRFSALITALSVAVPVVLVSLLLRHLPLDVKMPYIMLSAGIPFLIALPVSIFALRMLMTINQTVDMVNDLVRFDPLTGVLCRSHFYHSWRESRRNGGFLAIVDADHFKSVNDTFGHEGGDEALKHLANAMTQAVSSPGLVGRLGGEEFCIYLPGVSRAEARMIMVQIGGWLRQHPFAIGQQSHTITVSIGLTQDNPGETISNVIRRADKCLYAAKASGRDRCIMEIELDATAKVA